MLRLPRVVLRVRCGDGCLLRKLIEARVQLSYVRLKSIYGRLEGLGILRPGDLHLERVEIRRGESAQLGLYSRELGLKTFDLCIELRSINGWRSLHLGFKEKQAIFKSGGSVCVGRGLMRRGDCRLRFARKPAGIIPYQGHAAEKHHAGNGYAQDQIGAVAFTHHGASLALLYVAYVRRVASLRTGCKV
ncbi:hypothetical protein Nwi_1637 [Nitrobacter winogradskyi Nb-255]|uniref:Uncharacterized protein n=1 Tax=Nitrobacter winogradskyi (strain ATCC 25391 / DSM 10237 / CIP 104748 / NCIMB 11846 / Nb-255) TaxID=323098 RepID=Q3SS43_NITWN|nr:hypothetical protein Nwi_1637 [Nitrobacter winogradskyi Nb-255]